MGERVWWAGDRWDELAAKQVERGKSAERQAEESNTKIRWQERVSHSLSLSLKILSETPELQGDPILGLQHNSWHKAGNPWGIQWQLKAKQGQGHGHLHLIHGKLLPDAVPGPRRENEMRSALRSCSELGRHWPLTRNKIFRAVFLVAKPWSLSY